LPQFIAQFKSSNRGGIMAATLVTPSWQAIGRYVQFAGAGAFLVGALLSLHHHAIGICFLAGAAAFYAGKKMRSA
jgi:hypothetical protein